MGQYFKGILPGLFLAIIIAACTLPARTPNPVATLQAVYTSQVGTVQVLQTQTASSARLTSPPTNIFPTLLPTVVIPSLTHQVVTQVSTRILPSYTPHSYCNLAAYIKDMSVPDGTVFSPGQKFTKTWKLKNIGTCTWTKSYQLVFLNGTLMHGVSGLELPARVSPGKTVDISIDLTAPESEGSFRGNWLLRNSSGSVFGLGTDAATPFYVDIQVISPVTTMLDFATSYCSAVWRSGAGVLGCPGDTRSKNGYVTRVENPQLENGHFYSGQGLLVEPEKVTDGTLQGYYPAYTVQSGDHFRALINCAYLATGCYATFRLDYQVGDGPVKTIWHFIEAYEGQYYPVDIDLAPLAGNTVKFILSVLATGSADADKVIWVAPRIERPSHLVTPTATTTLTATLTRTATLTATHTVTPFHTTTLTATVTTTVTSTPVSTHTPTSTASATETPTVGAFLATMTPTETAPATP